MSRIGFQVNEESADICKEISAMPNLFAEGLFSHFATADETDLTKSIAQRDKFVEFIEYLENRGVNIPLIMSFPVELHEECHEPIIRMVSWWILLIICIK